jgi:hypothetical protein
LAGSAEALEGIERAVQITLYESFIADDFVHVRIAGQNKSVESGAAEGAESALANGLLIVAHDGGYCLAGSFSPCCATILVVVGPRFAAFVAQDSPDAPARRSDLIYEDALADGLRVVFFKQSVEHHGEFLETGPAIEYGVDYIA